MVKKIYKLERVLSNRFIKQLSKEIQSGFTLIELMVVVTILGILVMITVPSALSTVEKARQKACLFDMKQLERMYRTYLIIEEIEHTDMVFNQFLLQYEYDRSGEKCEPNFVDGEVQCSKHIEDKGTESEEHDEETGDEVPFL